MDISAFDYHLPKESIAQRPAYPKSYARMLVVNTGLTDHRFYEIIDWFRPGDVLVVNDTRVSQAKLKGRKGSGSPVELILMHQQEGTWTCRIKGRNVLTDTELLFPDNLKCMVVDKQEDLFLVRFSKTLQPSYISNHATLPTPPYIKEPLRSEREYQTTYARHAGSLAAPTAGLHFTPHLLRRIRNRGVTIVSVCLHVGFGTFNPVRTDDVRDHQMEPEQVYIDNKTARAINERTGRLFVVGTTTMKALETAADRHGRIHPIDASSDLFIYPGYTFKMRPYGFITNFHLPKSTLLLLVSAYAGWKRIKEAYEHAVSTGYRFFSLGDCMLLENMHPQ